MESKIYDGSVRCSGSDLNSIAGTNMGRGRAEQEGLAMVLPAERHFCGQAASELSRDSTQC